MIRKLKDIITDIVSPETSAQPDLTPIRSEYPFKSNFMEMHGYRYHYIDEGQGDPVLMVHGNPTWSFFYRRMIKALSGEYRTIAVDHIGCGLSDKPQKYEYHLDDHIDNLEALVLRLDLKRITLVVHDWGGAIGMGCAIRHPHRFKRFVIMNTAAFTSPHMPPSIWLCRAPVLGDFLVRNLNLFAETATKNAVANPLTPLIAEGMKLPYDSYDHRIAIYRFVQDIPMLPEDYSYESLLQIEHGLWMFRECPIALIWGMQDWCFTPQNFLRVWRDIYPGARVLEIDHAGHYLLEDAPVEVIRYVRDFFADTFLEDE